MREQIEQEIQSYIVEYCRKHQQEVIWECPIVKYAAADDPRFEQLKELVVPDHYLPADYLPEAKTVLSYFLPFKKEIEMSNRGGTEASEIWAKSYLITNEMAVELNNHIAEFVEKMGYAAAVPTDAGMISQKIPKSRWSQRHIAYIAGQGTFGMNNMLISDKGCVGRYFSLVTTLQTEPDAIPQEERCLYKKNGKCVVGMPCSFRR